MCVSEAAGLVLTFFAEKEKNKKQNNQKKLNKGGMGGRGEEKSPFQITKPQSNLLFGNRFLIEPLCLQWAELIPSHKH